MTTHERAGLDDESLGLILETLQEMSRRSLPREERLRLDESEEFPEDLVREMLGPEFGLHLIFLPEEVGGLGGGARDLFRVSEESARIDLGVATAFLAIALGVDPILVGGTPEQKELWLGRIAEGLIVAYAVTEPDAGSNVAALQTVAEPMAGDDGATVGYRISGTKQFITNGGVAQIYTVLARTPGGPSFFVVDRDTPGLEVGALERKHGIRASNTTQVLLEDVRVDADQLLGREEGKGLEQANRVFGYTRLMVAGFGLGAGEEALARAIDYAKQRQQFGEPLFHKRGFTHKLIVPHAVRLEAARAYCEEVAERLDAGEPGLQVEGSIAKYFATEAGNAAADAALQAHGGYGYTHEYEVEKIRRDVRITTIYEGTSEIQQNIIGTHRWRSTVRSKGAFYADMAEALRSAGGQEAAALAADGFGRAILELHKLRLPRHQWVLFELARVAAEVETALALARKVRARELPGEKLELASALHASQAAYEVATTTLRILRSTGELEMEELGGIANRVGTDRLLEASSGSLPRLDRLAELLFAS